jgi:hypothetical protein
MVALSLRLTLQNPTLADDVRSDLAVQFALFAIACHHSHPCHAQATVSQMERVAARGSTLDDDTKTWLLSVRVHACARVRARDVLCVNRRSTRKARDGRVWPPTSVRARV